MNDKSLDEAKKRMEAGRKAREERRKNIKPGDEPNTLVSGSFDEIELKREEKYGEKNDNE